jgi:uncharacterized protein YjiS (DUF1127 family)
MAAIRTGSAQSMRNVGEPVIYRTLWAVGAAGIGDAWAIIRAGLERHRYRQELRRLLRVGPHMIADVGLTQAQAGREAKKSFWQR